MRACARSTHCVLSEQGRRLRQKKYLYDDFEGGNKVRGKGGQFGLLRFVG